VTRFCLFDVSNLIYRLSFAGKLSDSEDSANLVLANAIRSMRVPYDRFKSKHPVMCFDHASWRKREFPEYKANRDDRKSGPEARAFDAIVSVISDFREFLTNNTNSTVLHAPNCEADDLIARFAAIHPDDDHVIVSSDSDFKQLVSERVWVYNPVSTMLLTHEGIFLNRGVKLKRGTPTKMIFGEEWEVVLEDGVPAAFDPKKFLFAKILDGDKGDNVPRASVPFTKKKLIEEAWAYPDGIAWNNIMNAVRTDLDGSPKVGDLFERNRRLIDLSAIPDDICRTVDETILRAVQKPSIASLGMKFLMFCRSRGMIALGTELERYVPMLASRYVDA